MARRVGRDCLFGGNNTGVLVSWLGYFFFSFSSATVAYATEGEWVEGVGWEGGREEVASGGGGLVVMRYWEDGR